MTAATEIAAQTLETEYAKILEFQPADGTLLLRAGVGWREGAVGTAVVPSGRASQAGYTLLENLPVIVCDFATETRFSAPPLLVEHGIESGISAVIPGSVFPLGVIGVHSRTPRSFDESDAAFVKSIANILSEAIQRNLSDRDLRRTLERLRKSDDERRRLLAHLVRAEEQERRRIAADIHDDSIQVMSALALRLDLIRDYIEDAEVRATVDDLTNTVGAALIRLRQLIFDLVPTALHEDGLVPALRLHLDRLESEFALECTVHDELTREPGQAARGVLFRITLEALANVIKHAGATMISVRLWNSDEGACVSVSDNGRGFIPPSDPRSPPGHIGLTSMRERAELVGGSFMLTSRPGAGTTVEVVVPDELDGEETA